MRRVIVESPYAGSSPDDVAYNERYARAALADCLRRGEAPFASHLLYTQRSVLDDKNPEERKLGIAAGFAWRASAEATIVYDDLGITEGMKKGIEHAEARRALGHLVEYRQLGGEWSKPRDRIDENTPSYWHGCWLEAGHYLHARGGKSIDDRIFKTPQDHIWLDAGFAPIRDRYNRITFVMSKSTHEERKTLSYAGKELPQGQFLRHEIKDYRGDVHTLLAWWDRTQGDTRGACNSCYIIKGTHSTDAMLKWFPIHFPKQAERLEIAGVKLVEVVPT